MMPFNAYKVLIFSMTLLAVMGIALIVPVLPDIALYFSVSAELVGLVTIAYAFPGIFVSFVVGALADRFGRKAVLLPGILLFVFGGIACGLASSFSELIICRTIQGFGGGVLGVLYMTLPVDLYKGSERTTIMGQTAAAASLGVALFPAVGGLLGEISWQAPFFFSTSALPIGVIVLMVDLPNGNKSMKWKEYITQVKSIALKSKVLVVFSITFLTYCIYYGAINTYFPIMVNERFGVRPSEIGITFGVLAVGVLLSSLRLDFFYRKYGLYCMLICAGFSYVLAQLFFIGMPTMWLMGIPLLLQGLAQGITIPLMAERLATIAAKETRTSIIALNGTIFRGAQSVAPILFGFFWSLFGWKGPYFLGVGCAVVLLIVVVLFRNKWA